MRSWRGTSRSWSATPSTSAMVSGAGTRNGRKTDIKDAEWLAQLLRHGLIRASFVPPPAFRELRELLRFGRGMVQDGARLRNRMIRRLEAAGIKLAAVASNVFGVSGRAMLRALIDGTQNPGEIAELARRRMRSKLPALTQALDGRLGDRFLLDLDLRQLERLEADLGVLDERIEEKMAPDRGGCSVGTTNARKFCSTLLKPAIRHAGDVALGGRDRPRASRQRGRCFG
jgi:hypothetical protein